MWVEEVGLIEQDLTQHMDLDWRIQKDSIHGSICRAGLQAGVQQGLKPHSMFQALVTGDAVSRRVLYLVVHGCL